MAKRKSVTVEKGIFYQYDPDDENGRKYYYVRVNGDRTYCGEGELGYSKAKMARAELEKKRTLSKLDGLGLDQDADAIRERDKRRPQFKTVTGLLNWYMGLPQVEAQKSHTRKVISASHVLDYFGKMHPADIEGDTTEYYREHRKTKGAAENTINHELALLSVAYNTAIKRKKLPADCKPGEIVIVDDRNPRPIITDAQYKKLLEGASPDLKDILIAAHQSAMRSGELCNLRVGQVQLDAVLSQVPPVRADYIDLGIFDTKTKTKRTVPVSSAFKEVLQRRMEGKGSEDHVFTKKDGKPWRSANISVGFTALCKKVGIPYGDKLLNDKGERIGIVFHCFRHTRTTKWVEMGFSDELVRRATGHKSLQAYQAYVHLNAGSVMRLVSNQVAGVEKSMKASVNPHHQKVLNEE